MISWSFEGSTSNSLEICVEPQLQTGIDCYPVSNSDTEKRISIAGISGIVVTFGFIEKLPEEDLLLESVGIYLPCKYKHLRSIQSQ